MPQLEPLSKDSLSFSLTLLGDDNGGGGDGGISGTTPKTYVCCCYPAGERASERANKRPINRTDRTLKGDCSSERRAGAASRELGPRSVSLPLLLPPTARALSASRSPRPVCSKSGWRGRCELARRSPDGTTSRSAIRSSCREEKIKREKTSSSAHNKIIINKNVKIDQLVKRD